jgi:hypothetical protein
MENRQSILEEFKTELSKIIGSCNSHAYPNICQLRNTKSGEEQIIKSVLDICNKTGMSIASAAAQYESSLS